MLLVYSFVRSSTLLASLNVKEGLELDDELPLVVGDLLAVELLETVDALAGDLAVERVLLFEMAAVGGLVAAHFDLDGDRRLTLFAYWNLLVISLN